MKTIHISIAADRELLKSILEACGHETGLKNLNHFPILFNNYGILPIHKFGRKRAEASVATHKYFFVFDCYSKFYVTRLATHILY